MAVKLLTRNKIIVFFLYSDVSSIGKMLASFGFGVSALLILVSQAVATETQPYLVVNGSDVYGAEEYINQSSFWIFRGIRYGKAPTDSLRFARSEPEPLPPMINATSSVPHCYPIYPDPLADEDCLFLNIYTPASNGSNRPVIIYIHGGGNVMGNLDQKPSGGHLVVSGDIIVVTIQYRLGPLGFLSTGTSDVSGNMGLWDQNLALKWVSQYIQYFGGDANQITLMGESAGAKAVSLHTVSPYSKELFRRGFMGSGSLYGPTFYARDAPLAAKRLAKNVNCSTTSVREMVSCLKQVPAANLSIAGFALWPESALRTVLDFGWGAVLDDDFIPPLEGIQGAFSGDVMLTLNNNEGSLVGWRLNILESIMPGAQTALFSCDGFKAGFINESLHQYFRERPSCSAVKATFDLYANCVNGSVSPFDVLTFYGDMQYMVPAIRFLQKRVATGIAYLYYFDHDVPRNDRLGPEYLRGALHTDDYNYVMGAPPINGYSPEIAERERNLSKIMMNYLINFVKTGNPNLPTNPTFEFPVYDATGDQYFLRINATILQDGNATSALTDSHFMRNKMDFVLKDLPSLMRLSRSCDTSSARRGQPCGWLLTAAALCLFLRYFKLLIF